MPTVAITYAKAVPPTAPLAIWPTTAHIAQVAVQVIWTSAGV